MLEKFLNVDAERQSKPDTSLVVYIGTLLCDGLTADVICRVENRRLATGTSPSLPGESHRTPEPMRQSASDLEDSVVGCSPS